MPDLILDTPLAVPLDASTADVLRGALQESRQRWRHLVGLAADLAFETDIRGRFVFVLPAAALGWPSGSLIGQPSELLVGDDGSSPLFNPFRPTHELRRRRSWVRRYDGSLAMLDMSTSPLVDDAGTIVGARGIGIDMAEYDNQSSIVARRLRRGDMLDHILSRLGHESDTDRMMDVALWSMVHAMDAEGAAVVGALSEGMPVTLMHECGIGADAVLEAAAHLVSEPGTDGRQAVTPEGRMVLVAGCRSRFGANTGLAIWRNATARQWDREDTMLVSSATSIVRMILDYEAIHREMALQARTDPLTGLLNRRAFLEEMKRHLSRLDREAMPGTLLFIDIDAFKAVNDRLGHALGDAVLVCLADMLRKLVRPSDLIARLGGDEFALWLSGADHMTAAERADQLCRNAPAAFQAVLGQESAGLGVSIGIATRRIGSIEPIQELSRRADSAMYEVKRSGRGHWRVSLLDGD